MEKRSQWACLFIFNRGYFLNFRCFCWPIYTEVNQNPNRYINTLGSSLLPLVASMFGGFHPWLFQQHNSPIHTAFEIRKWLTERQMRTLPLVAKSPELNIIVNTEDFSRGRFIIVFDSFTTLRSWNRPSRGAWDDVPSDYIFKLYRSISRRLMDVIDAKGNATKYCLSLYVAVCRLRCAVFYRISQVCSPKMDCYVIRKSSWVFANLSSDLHLTHYVLCNSEFVHQR